MPIDSVSENIPISRKLFELANEDCSNLSSWSSDKDYFNRLRLGERAHRRLPYAGAPNFIEPIIDDTISRTTEIQNRVLWQQQFIATFIPMSAQAYEMKEKVERSFHYLLSTLLQIRRTLSMTLDSVNEAGVSFQLLTVNEHSYERVFRASKQLPDIEYLHRDDLILPPNTKRIQDTHRFIRVVSYVPETFAIVAQNLGWKDWKTVIRNAKSRNEGKNSSHEDLTGYHPRIRTSQLQQTDNQIVVHEGYYHDKQGNKRFIQYPQHMPNHILLDKKWEWNNLPFPRRWPIIDFIREDRAPGIFDSRGLAETLADNQKAASQIKNVQGELLDYTGRPMTRGGNPMSMGRTIKPGGNLPEGVEIIPGQELPQSLALLIDGERAMAARRGGSDSGAVSSVRQAKEPVTATEINRGAISADMLTLGAVTRFNEPLSVMFSMMWEWLQNNPVSLPIISDNFEFEDDLDLGVYELPFQVMASANSRNSDPIFVLNQLVSLLPFIQQAEEVDQSIIWRHVINQLDPTLADRAVVDTSAGAPIVKQMQQLIQHFEQLTQVVQENREYITTEIEEDEENTRAQE